MVDRNLAGKGTGTVGETGQERAGTGRIIAIFCNKKDKVKGANMGKEEEVKGMESRKIGSFP